MPENNTTHIDAHPNTNIFGSAKKPFYFSENTETLVEKTVREFTSGTLEYYAVNDKKVVHFSTLLEIYRNKSEEWSKKNPDETNPYKRYTKNTHNDLQNAKDPEHIRVTEPEKCTPEQARHHILTALNAAIEQRNELMFQIRPSKNKIDLPTQRYVHQLPPAAVADLMIFSHNIVCIAPSNTNTDQDSTLIGIFDTDPKSKYYGVYNTSNQAIYKVARDYSPNLSTKDTDLIIQILRSKAPEVTTNTNQDLIAVNNGIFDYKNKKLLDFSPEYVFTTKCQTNYNSDATNPVLTHPDDPDYQWDVESWITDFFTNDDTGVTDDGVVNLIWQIIGACIRPHVAWNKSAWFYSTKGNNGKGSLVALMRNLLGPAAHTSIPLSDFSKDFMLEPLTRATAVLVDENDVGTFIDKAANLKAIITGDVILINRKHKYAVPFQFHGFMVQCLNEMPRVRDTSESFYRRQLFVPFEKSFTGRERTYIKSDFLQREEVLEYVLKRVLNDMDDYYQFDVPDTIKEVFEDYKDFNDPVRAFWKEHKDRFVWDRVPTQFMFDIYSKWYNANMSGRPMGRNTFLESLRKVIEIVSPDEWDSETKKASMSHITAAEPMIVEYDLVDRWGNNQVGKNNPQGMSAPRFKANRMNCFERV